MSKILKPKVSVATVNNSSATIVIEPTQGGYGNTLANSIRRALLSSIEGAAITAFKVDNVAHEFSVIPGVKEDVVDIILNLKQVRFTMNSEEPVILTLDVKSSGEVKAGDIKGIPSVCEVVNADQVLFNVEGSKVDIKFVFRVEKNYGYLNASQQVGIPVDMIAIDSLFSPVKRVRYEVSGAREGRNTNLDKITLVVDTDGSISPIDAFEQANTILMEQYLSLGGKASAIAKDKIDQEPAQIAQLDEAEVINRSVESLGLKARTAKALQDANIMSVGDILQYNDADLLALGGFGRGALNEVKEKLVELGI